MPGFSSTQNKGPSAGGSSSSSMIATALVAKSGSRSFIQVLKTVQANLVPLEDDADGALAGMPEAEFGVGRQILGQVLDGPVGLPDACRIDFRGCLAGQHQQARLDIGVVLTRRWTLGVVLETIQTLCGETVAPDEDGANGQTHLMGNGRVGLIVGDAQDDLGAIGGLLSRGTSGHDALQFSAFGGQQANTGMTGSGTRHVHECSWCFPLQPAHLHINSRPT